VVVPLGTAVLFVVAWMLVHQGPLGRSQIRDTPRYEMYARAMQQHQVPYRDFTIEYPPGALLPIAAPLVAASSSHDSYRHWFEIWTALAGAALAALTSVLALELLTPFSAAVGSSLLIALLPLELGTVVLTRFDLWPALFVAAGILCLVRSRAALSGIAIGIAVAMKIYAAVLVPLVVLYAGARWGRAAAWRFVAGVAGAVAAVVVPFAVLSPGGVWSTFSHQAGRALQFETLGSSLLLAAAQVFHKHLERDFSNASQNLGGPLPDHVATVQVVLQVAAILTCWVAFARGERTLERLFRYSAAAVTAFAVLGKVLSPQYLIWLVPMVCLIEGKRGNAARLTLLAAMLATQLWFPTRYWDLVLKFDPFSIWALLARDLLLVSLLGTLLIPTSALSVAARRRERRAG
jgi:Glycosyltransferase family 87